MRTTTTVVIGAGQAGLATSRYLTRRGIDHVLLERGHVASSWQRRWESLRLLTPNWQSRLPGFRCGGDDPDGYMTMPEVIGHLGAYASAIDAPVRTNTRVTSVRATDGGFAVSTSEGPWRCRAVVVASGACDVAAVPAVAAGVPTSVVSVTSAAYRNPATLPSGGVLVVGAAATGIQLAHELHRSGRPVTIAVGEHVRAPRLYRGRDIMWWLDRAGILDEGPDDVDNIVRARGLPSFQLVGSPERGSLDLNRLQAEGVRIVGRLVGFRDGIAQCSGSLRNVCRLADLKQARLLTAIDRWCEGAGLDAEVGPPERPEPTRVPDDPPLAIDLAREGITSILWATGYRPDLSWLHVPVLDRKGEVRHDGGITPAPGLYVLGMPFLRRRKSTLIDGVGDDARHVTTSLSAHLDRCRTPASGVRILRA